MQQLKLVAALRYSFGGVIYEKGTLYPVKEDLADVLLSKENEDEMPYFAVATKKDIERAAAVAQSRLARGDDEADDDGAAASRSQRGRRVPGKKAAKKAAKAAAATGGEGKSDGDEGKGGSVEV